MILKKQGCPQRCTRSTLLNLVVYSQLVHCAMDRDPPAWRWESCMRSNTHAITQRGLPWGHCADYATWEARVKTWLATADRQSRDFKSLLEGSHEIPAISSTWKLISLRVLTSQTKGFKRGIVYFVGTLHLRNPVRPNARTGANFKTWMLSVACVPHSWEVSGSDLSTGPSCVEWACEVHLSMYVVRWCECEWK